MNEVNNGVVLSTRTLSHLINQLVQGVAFYVAQSTSFVFSYDDKTIVIK